MNEMTKTLLFVGAAVLATGVAVGTRSGSPSASAPIEISEPLFPTFTDPVAAASLKIVRFDESLASIKELEVKKSNGIWTLPSHDGYPADAENRIRDAATPFIDLRPLAVSSDKDGEHAQFGVLEPSIDKSAVGDQGVGTLVNIKDESGNNLVNLIIGKEVQGNPEQRYVRRPGQSVVFVAKVDPNNLPVKFEDWIDKDLLALNNWDMTELVLKDYSFQVAASLSGPITDFDERFEMTVGEDNGVWKVNDLLVSDGNDLKPRELKETEKLNDDRLRALREALDTLEIVDAQRKPENLRADMKVEEGFASDQAGMQSLIQHGFYPVQMPTGEVQVLSADGEVRVRTKEGVEYMLRFGKVEGVDTEGGEGKLNRYLLVTAKVNEGMFPEPELEVVPETIEDLEKPANSAELQPEGESTSSRELAAETLPVAIQNEDDEPAADDTATESDVVAEDEGNTEENAEASSDETATDAGQAVESNEDVETTTDEPVAEVTESVAEDESATDQDATDTADATAAQDDQTPALSEEQLKAELQRERERITKENQRKIDERNDKLTKAQKKVQELNYRFADWYYVISEDVYKKIHLSQLDLIQEKTEATESTENQGFGPDALRSLENAVQP
ncbi:MAG: DUF4340 domain-containing protein [Planctomycetales bacterium]|nr:DUF4340 domain-containing protein [Planctomycetales bacterium]